MSDKYEKLFGELHEILVEQAKVDSIKTVVKKEPLYDFSSDGALGGYLTYIVDGFRLRFSNSTYFC